MKTISVFCCLLYATWTEGAKINEEGFEGGEVSFQCSYKFAWKNDKYFCKDKCKEAEDILATVKSGATAESGRITLADSGNRVFTVTFHQLQLSDSGKYWCGVDRPGFDTYTEVILTVKEVPHAVTVNETKVIPDVSPTKTYQNVSNTTQLAYNTSGPTNQSTASNSTNGGEPSMSTTGD
ncbi:CMRF35-like molecule 5 [Seriola aureovittata]|uniref:CMRF35-like molecule 5 n=1 Tax=Seriola aureovittata TaxID=2871759 RepID=UPI0024BDA7BA|nr:CMRF35-like molecule 5 [Seriola aureovittata]